MGSATDAPSPRSTVRRESCFTEVLRWGAPTLRQCPHSERAAVHNLAHQSPESIVVFREFAGDLINDHVVRTFDAAANRVSQKSLRKVPREEAGISLQCFLQGFGAHE